MKRVRMFGITLCLVVLAFACSGCSAAKKQAAYEAGMNQASSQIKRVETETLDSDSLSQNLGVKVAENKEKNKEVHTYQEGAGGEYSSVDVLYVIDTLNNRVHKHNSGCSLLGSEDGRATLENWMGTPDEAEAAGYTKCPECILKLY